MKSFITKNKAYWFVGDFETLTTKTKHYQETKKTKVILFSIANLLKEEVVKNGVNIDEFFNYLLDLNHSLTIFFHNLSFDGTFIADYLNNSQEWTYDELQGLKNHSLKKHYYIFRRNNKIFYICLKFRNKQKTKITIFFRCSYLLLLSSVKSLAKAFGASKFKEDDDLTNFYDHEPFNNLNEVPLRFLEYVNNDCLIVCKALNAFKKAILNLDYFKTIQNKNNWDLFNVFKFLTISSLSFKLMQKYINKAKHFKSLEYGDLYIELKGDKYDDYRPFFNGGLTQFNPLFQSNSNRLKNSVYIDVNSAYPYWMSQELPYGDFLENKPNYPYYEFVIVNVKSAKIKKGFENFIVLKKWDKAQFDAGVRYTKQQKDFTCFYLKQEWDILNEIYDFEIYDIKSFYTYKKAYLKDYILDIFNKRVEFGNLNNEAFKFCFKILLNSGYGSLAQKNEYDNLFYFYNPDFKEDEIIKINNSYFQFNYISNNYSYGDLKACNFSPYLKQYKKTRNLLAASVITSLQRVYIIKTVIEIGIKNFAYCDTDSIIFYDLNNDQINKINQMVSNRLGDWKIEETKGNIFKVFGAKKYCLKQDEQLLKYGFSGVGYEGYDYNQLFNMDFNLNSIDLINATKKATNIQGGKIIEVINKKIKRGLN